MQAPPIPHEVKLRALAERDEAYAGLFYTAVKTTGIFCRIGCPAKTPKPENVFFFDTIKEALDAGFRACKICKPLENVGETPDAIRNLLVEIHANPERRVKDSELRRRGLQPETVRRWFKRHHQITFQAYQRYLKIGNAVQHLKLGKSVTSVALENYDSLSGFQDSFKSALGKSPTATRNTSMILVTRIPTPLGLMMACAVNNELCLLEFCDRRMLATELDEIQKLLNGVPIVGHCELFDPLRQQLDEYFSGKRHEFSVPLKLLGTPFQQLVWRGLLEIPYGMTRSYKEQARSIGKPEAVRAVGRANGQNRIAIIVPCHRVIGENGSLTGYGGGLDRKRWLLNHESGAAPQSNQQKLFKTSAA